MEAEVANFDKILSIMSTFGKHIQKLNQIIISTELHHFSFFRAIFAFLATHPVVVMTLAFHAIGPGFDSRLRQTFFTFIEVLEQRRIKVLFPSS